jgi:hypothetical protein
MTHALGLRGPSHLGPLPRSFGGSPLRFGIARDCHASHKVFSVPPPPSVL